ncbi:hypothetical protein J6590_039521 [Homalodisca vitripennis]|nr:hypothetical protein J6590_039521 [Homalodisca vitripennis]
MSSLPADYGVLDASITVDKASSVLGPLSITTDIVGTITKAIMLKQELRRIPSYIFTNRARLSTSPSIAPRLNITDHTSYVILVGETQSSSAAGSNLVCVILQFSRHSTQHNNSKLSGKPVISPDLPNFPITFCRSKIMYDNGNDPTFREGLGRRQPHFTRRWLPRDQRHSSDKAGQPPSLWRTKTAVILEYRN